VDWILVGDSAAMTVLGYATTRELPEEELLVLTRAVCRSVQRTPVIGDLPFGTYETSPAQAVAAAQRFVAAGCDAVKLEGARLEQVAAIVAAGIPVIGHVGLLPQDARSVAELRARGRVADEALRIVRDAEALQAAGCTGLVIEATPAVVAAEITRRLRIPVTGIGAGADVDGQVLVWHDVLGITPGKLPRFVRRYAALADATQEALGRYAADVRARRFPAQAETYAMEESELQRFLEALRA
jgi:3-methyl-2-oxobutanoate hydroxymethyltransferase